MARVSAAVASATCDAWFEAWLTKPRDVPLSLSDWLKELLIAEGGLGVDAGGAPGGDAGGGESDCCYEGHDT